MWVLLFTLASCAPPATLYDTVIRDGTVYDGSGARPIQADVAISGDSIVAIGAHLPGTARKEIKAQGLAVAPGFINMLSWATETLIEDGRSQGDIRQGVTLEVMGEGGSMGPLNDTLRKLMSTDQGDIRYPVTWELGTRCGKVGPRNVTFVVPLGRGSHAIRRCVRIHRAIGRAHSPRQRPVVFHPWLGEQRPDSRPGQRDAQCRCGG
jgi:N-acyl-D-amino-acid deacylase